MKSFALVSLLLFPSASQCLADAKLPQTELLEEIVIDSVWAANKVSFDLHTTDDMQFVAYYDKDRMMTVASRKLGSHLWEKKNLPNRLRWDSHNYVAMGIDEAGHLHVSGNLHVNPLAYFRSEKPWDVSSLREINRMVGEDEGRVTYPRFFNASDGALLFSYRSGTCGNGNILVNRYDAGEGKWERHLTTPLFEGSGAEDTRSAYHQIKRDAKGDFHFAWIWRWNPLAETSHQICYATTPDLIHWKNAAGEKLELPFRPDNPKTIVDPVPSKGGAINSRLAVLLTRDDKPLVGYVKYDEEGMTQFYLAKPDGGTWRSRQISDWDFRWEFTGGGDKMTKGVQFNFAGLSPQGRLVFDWATEKGQSGKYAVDPDSLELVSEAVDLKPRFPAAARKQMSTDPALSVNLQEGKGAGPETGVRYVLKWESMGASHGKHAPAIIPEGPLSRLVLLKIQ